MPESGLAGIAQLGQAQKQEAFLHSLMDQLCGRERCLNRFGGILVVSPIAEAFKEFIIQAVGTSQLGQQEIAKKLADAGVEQKEVLAQAIEARRQELESRFKEQSSAIGTQKHLEDFDWSLRLVVCSDRLAVGMREPRLLLKFNLRDAVEDRVVAHQLELGADQLDHLLAKFGDIQGIVQQYSGAKI